METLPVEMVERIVQQLTPLDLARCSAVCHEWREIFNQDWMWKPHCDPELEEPLRTTPCVATPAFVAPEAEDSTLSPISHWKLAFMRENHLWKNWRRKEMMEKDEEVTKFDDDGIKGVDFLTDTLVVVWYPNQIDIFDVSTVPTRLVAKTKIAVCNECKCYYRPRVIGSTTLLVDKDHSIQVFNVDISSYTIKLNYTIPLTRGRMSAAVGAKQQVYICFYYEGPKHQIFDINTGTLLKEELSPVKITQNERVHYWKVKTSLASDFVACELMVKDNSNGKEYFKYYIYSVKQLAFLPGPLAVYEDSYLETDFAMLGHWIATTDSKILQVHNFQTGDVLLSHKNSKPSSFVTIEACNDCFVFLHITLDESEQILDKFCIYFPSNKSLTTLCEMSDLMTFRIINNKFIELIHGLSKVSVWKLSGQMVEKCDFTWFGYKTNRSFTKVLHGNYLKGKFTRVINHVW